MIAYKILTEFPGNSSEKLHCGNVVIMPYWIIAILLSFRIVSTKPKLNVFDDFFMCAVLAHSHGIVKGIRNYEVTINS